MPIDLAHIENLLLLMPGDSQVTLAANRQEVTTRTGRIAKWAAKFRPSENRRTLSLFIESLQDAYGQGIPEHLVRTTGIDIALRRGWPLHTRKVREIVGQAGILSELFGKNRTPRPRWTRDPVTIKRELTRELHTALTNGYVNQAVLRGDPACKDPMPDTRFVQFMMIYNHTMRDLRGRFPQLGDVKPPNLSQSKLGQEDSLRVFLQYDQRSQAILFSDREIWDFAIGMIHALEIGFTSPKAGGLAGLLTHEYAHHLTLNVHPAPLKWISGLLSLLRAQGFISSDSRITPSRPYDPTFRTELGENVRRLGLGSVAGKNVLEFGAEALAWRISPGYGESREIPRMPRFLEDWVHEFFPYTRDGPIPADSVELKPVRTRKTVADHARIELQSLV